MIGLERKLARWTAAGLLDDSSARAIRDFEKQKGGPALVWTVASLALLALALGIALLVGANWDLIPGWVKLGVHFMAMLAALAAWMLGRRRQRPWLSEAALFLLATLVLAGIALQGQVYQQSGPLWQPLVLWMLLCAPALVLLGSSWLNGSLLALMAGALLIALLLHGLDLRDGAGTMYVGAAGAIPFLLVALSAFDRNGSPVFLAARNFGLAYVLLIASIAHAAWSAEITPDESRDALEALILPLLAALACLLALRGTPGGVREVVSTVIAASFLAAAVALVTPHDANWYWRLAGLVFFCAMWGAILRAAAAGGWRTLYGFGVAAIAVRLILVYFEVFGSLASTGLGLIAAGVLALLLLAAWQKIMRILPRDRGGAA